MSSFLHKLFLVILRNIPGKDPLTKALDQKVVLREEPKSKVVKKFDISISDYKGYRVYCFGKPINGKPIIYYNHGGGFAVGMCSIHYIGLCEMYKMMGCSIICLDFPLPPETDAQGVHDFVLDHYRHIANSYPDSPIIMTGDSAGGNLALSITQALSLDERKQIKGLFPLFPFLDARRDTAQYKIHKEEVLLSPKLMQRCTDHWIGRSTAENPIISPILGDLTKLPPLHVYSADKDPLHQDAVDLSLKMESLGEVCNHHIFKGYGHDFIFFPTPDAKRGVKEITEQMKTCLQSLD